MTPLLANASATNLDSISGVPNLSSVLNGWVVDLGLNRVVKFTEDFQIRERLVAIAAQGIWQPFDEEQLKILREGQRSWRWYMVHITPESTRLNTDDIIVRADVRHRVMGIMGYDDNGFVQYRIVNEADMEKGAR